MTRDEPHVSLCCAKTFRGIVTPTAYRSLVFLTHLSSEIVFAELARPWDMMD